MAVEEAEDMMAAGEVKEANDEESNRCTYNGRNVRGDLMVHDSVKWSNQMQALHKGMSRCMFSITVSVGVLGRFFLKCLFIAKFQT